MLLRGKEHRMPASGRPISRSTAAHLVLQVSIRKTGEALERTQILAVHSKVMPFAPSISLESSVSDALLNCRIAQKAVKNRICRDVCRLQASSLFKSNTQCNNQTSGARSEIRTRRFSSTVVLLSHSGDHLRLSGMAFWDRKRES